MSSLVWLVPSLITLILWGLGQGFVKMWIGEVSPARFCLYFVVAKSIVNLGYFFSNEHLDPFDIEGRMFLVVGIFAYILDGLGWILYFKSIVYGPITIVGTLSAAYPALTILMARLFLGEKLLSIQYIGVTIVILCCLGLSYTPPSLENKKVINNKWIPLAIMALLLWSSAQTIMKYSYNLPNADETNLLLFNTLGGTLTLGIYGLMYGLKGSHSGKEWIKSFLPMGMMAGGDMGFIIAASKGPISIISPMTGAYPLVTLIFAYLVIKEHITKFQWLCVVILLFGIFLSALDKEIIEKIFVT
jgi:drug/metabolite transporter (DMT)-like permease